MTIQADASQKGKEKKTNILVYVLCWESHPSNKGYKTFVHALPLQRPSKGIQGGARFDAACTKAMETLMRIRFVCGEKWLISKWIEVVSYNWRSLIVLDHDQEGSECRSAAALARMILVVP
ncbi:unnamed protein product, partial [Amoebophrya sp. A25]